MDDVVLCDASNGALYYDVSGLTEGGVIRFATLTGGPAVTAADFVVL